LLDRAVHVILARRFAVEDLDRKSSSGDSVGCGIAVESGELCKHC